MQSSCNKDLLSCKKNKTPFIFDDRSSWTTRHCQLPLTFKIDVQPINCSKSLPSATFSIRGMQMLKQCICNWISNTLHCTCIYGWNYSAKLQISEMTYVDTSFHFQWNWDYTHTWNFQLCSYRWRLDGSREVVDYQRIRPHLQKKTCRNP